MRSKQNKFGVALAAFSMLAGALVPGGSGCGTLETEDPLMVPIDAVGAGEEIVPDEYIFFYRDDVSDADKLTTERVLDEVHGTKQHDFAPFVNGFSAKLPAAGLERMRRNPALASIHPNGIIRATGVQTCPSWGLDVIDQAQSIVPNNVYNYAAAGTDVHVYVLDSGIDKDHSEFKRADGTSRVGSGQCVLQNGCANVEDWDDCQGHGTHLAGVVGGKTFGVAKDVTLHAVRVLKCDGTCNMPQGTEEDFIKGLNWVMQQVSANPDQKAVVLLGFSRQVQNWTNIYNDLNAPGNPFVVVAAAGNGGDNACKNMPGGKPQNAMIPKAVLTVGAFDETGDVWSLSNQGNCVDLFAPGTNISGPLSTDCSIKTSDTRSGTSAAAAHVAGVAALMLEGGIPAVGVKAAILNQAQTIQLGNLNANSPPLVLHTSGTSTYATSPTSATSMDVDADGCNDGALCSGGACTICGALPQQCNGIATGGGITCNPLGECDACGDDGQSCCPGAPNDFCADGFTCNGGTCSCGGPGQACCGGIGGGCDAPFECDGNGFCGPCGTADKVCCGGGCYGDNLSCHNNTCKKCGLDGLPCCDGGCNGDDLTCTNGTCAFCGQLGKPCCDGGCNGEGVGCNVNGQCDLCGIAGKPCCDGACLGDTLVCDGNLCEECGIPGKPCCNGGCVNDNLVCNTSDQCVACGGSTQAGSTQACCADDTCNNGYGCFSGKCEKCGGPGQQCCPDYVCAGDMVCDTTPNNTKCVAKCTARCQNGKLAARPINTVIASEFDCLQWAGQACSGQGWYTRVVFNGTYVDNLGENCGATNEACCLDTPNCYGNNTCEGTPDWEEKDIVYNNVKIGTYVGRTYCKN